MEYTVGMPKPEEVDGWWDSSDPFGEKNEVPLISPSSAYEAMFSFKNYSTYGGYTTHATGLGSSKYAPGTAQPGTYSKTISYSDLEKAYAEAKYNTGGIVSSLDGISQQIIKAQPWDFPVEFKGWNPHPDTLQLSGALCVYLGVLSSVSDTQVVYDKKVFVAGLTLDKVTPSSLIHEMLYTAFASAYKIIEKEVVAEAGKLLKLFPDEKDEDLLITGNFAGSTFIKYKTTESYTEWLKKCMDVLGDKYKNVQDK